MNKLFNLLLERFTGKNKLYAHIFPMENKTKTGRFVSYQFHIPGVKNFHLLPFRSKKQNALNIFKPHWDSNLSKMIY